MTTPIKTFIFGGRGMLAGEFARYTMAHPELEISAIVSREAFDPLLEHPHLSPAPLVLEQSQGLDAVRAALQGQGQVVAVSALPHGASAALFDELLDLHPIARETLIFIDLASDFRLADSALNLATYGNPAHGQQASFRYGLPELQRSPQPQGRYVAAPGCFATALQLATVPASNAGLLSVASPWIYFGITGSSGSGVSPKSGTHHPFREGNLWAYSTSGHRHEAELLQAVQPLEPQVHFVPHSGPFVRGIHMTATLPLVVGVTQGDLRSAFDRAYQDEPFVTRVDIRPPALRGVVGSNRAEVGVHQRDSTATVLVTLDNLGKGGAGQGMQALNQVLGFDETHGLSQTGQGVI